MDMEAGKTLTNEEVIRELLDLLKKNAMKEQANDVFEICSYVDGLEKKIDSMTEELTNMQNQIKEMQEDTLVNNAKKALSEAQERLNVRCERIKSQVLEVKAQVKSTAKSIVDEAKAKGRTALYRVSEFLAIKKRLLDIRENVRGAIKTTDKDIAKTALLAKGFREAGQTAANAFRTFADKPEVDYSQKEQKHRFKRLEDSSETAWRVTEGDWRRNHEYDQYLRINEEMIEKTDTGYAPWNIIEATDKNYATLKIIRCVTEKLEQALATYRANQAKAEADQNAEKHAGQTKTEPTSTTGELTSIEPKTDWGYENGILSGVDLTRTMDRDTYKQKIDQLQKRLEILHSEIYRLRIPVVLGFEGWDAGGKGGAIRRLTSHLDPRGYQVCPTSAPSDTEKRHHYLWRFWNRMPKEGHIAVFDRTWYGRVMVERIEGFCTEEEWRRAYQEINEMEAHLVSSGAVVLKFWLHIDKDEQERRFRERMENPEKQWKITDEDWRNREKWDQYELAVNEMLVRTSTTYAPWIVVEGNCKYYARVKVLETVVEALEKKIQEKTQSRNAKK